MKSLLEKHASKITGVLSCFDRMLFRGYLPIMSGGAMAQFLSQTGIKFRNLKTFLTEHAETLKAHAQTMAEREGRPYIYLASAGVRKEQRAQEIAEADGIKEGLVCVFAQLEPCRTFSFRFQQGRPFVNSARRKCLHIYYYFLDREFGLIHVMVQTWFPMRMQVFVNGHNWLANKLAANGIRFSQCDNVFLWIEDIERAQRFADRLASVNWPSVLNRYARKINPLMGSLLGRMQYYWVTSQCEYATDVMFRSAADLKELYRQLVSHSMQYFGAKEVMNFLGKKLVGQFRGEVVSDMTDRCKLRLPGTRVKHRAKMNWIKMYDKAGSVLRVETVINEPEAFKVRKRVRRKGRAITQWVPMRKGVANLFRYRDVCLAANGRYLEALAVVDDPSAALKQLDTITRPKRTRAGQSVKPFNPLSPDEQRIFKALLSGANTINGFRNQDIRARLSGSAFLRSCGRCIAKQSAKISRLLKRFHIYGLIAKVPRTRRWRLTKRGWALLSAAISLKEQTFPVLYAQASE
jgi:hypothetical protein